MDKLYKGEMWKVRNQKFHRKRVRNSERTALSSSVYILRVRYILTEMSEIQLFKGLIMKNDKGAQRKGNSGKLPRLLL